MLSPLPKEGGQCRPRCADGIEGMHRLRSGKAIPSIPLPLEDGGKARVRLASPATRQDVPPAFADGADASPLRAYLRWRRKRVPPTPARRDAPGGPPHAAA